MTTLKTNRTRIRARQKYWTGHLGKRNTKHRIRTRTTRKCIEIYLFRLKSRSCSNTLTSNVSCPLLRFTLERISLFLFRFQPQDIVLDTKLKPFIPEYVPAIGDIDAFLKVPRPDGKEDALGLTVLDEPSSKQSDPHVLGLEMLYKLNKPTATNLPSVGNEYRSTPVSTDVLSVPVERTKCGRRWQTSESDRRMDSQYQQTAESENGGHRSVSQVRRRETITDRSYVSVRRPMPDVDGLMQEWPTQFEDLLKEVRACSNWAWRIRCY